VYFHDDGTLRFADASGTVVAKAGKVGEARHEAERAVDALMPFVKRGLPIVGLEPSCIFGFRDEIPKMLKSDIAQQLAERTFTFEEFLAAEAEASRLSLPLGPAARAVLLHGHCHQKSFGVIPAVERVLRLVPDLKVETVESSCCGMAGAFGYRRDTIDISLAMAELNLLPAVRNASAETIIVADGTSCRQQIRDGTGRESVHVARVLAANLARA
jgi:Fe-S oxidoreductase